uniref:Uncharacterized protein n=1 Tax=Fagus sylvatica TaxID=28930 RepID=A0A2N9HXX6_FAGSY
MFLPLSLEIRAIFIESLTQHGAAWSSSTLHHAACCCVERHPLVPRSLMLLPFAKLQAWNKGYQSDFLVGRPFSGVDYGQLRDALDKPRQPASRSSCAPSNDGKTVKQFLMELNHGFGQTWSNLSVLALIGLPHFACQKTGKILRPKDSLIATMGQIISLTLALDHRNDKPGLRPIQLRPKACHLRLESIYLTSQSKLDNVMGNPPSTWPPSTHYTPNNGPNECVENHSGYETLGKTNSR